MKTTVLISMLLIATANLFATVLTVSNQTPNPGQYTSIQAAITAANPAGGDTIYVHASSITYVGFALDRQVTMIGSGFEPSSVNPNPYSKSNLGINFYNVNASGSKFIGIYFVGGNINFSNAPGLYDITFNRCEFESSTITIAPNCYNLTFTENYFYRSYFSVYNGAGTAHDILIANNVFYLSGGNGVLDNIFGIANFQIVNNLFYGNGASKIAGNPSSGFSFSNNIFNKISFTDISGCTFSNNITNQCTGDTPWINNGTDLGVQALGTQNIAATSPNFVNQANIDAVGYGGVNWFVVNPGSPTLSSMPGDPDMGPYGGSGSYNYSRASASILPYVYSLTIGNPTIQSGTNLNIDVIGKKHD